LRFDAGMTDNRTSLPHSELTATCSATAEKNGPLGRGATKMQILKWLLCICLLGIAGYMAITFLPEMANARCIRKWKDSGLNARFTFGVGCMVEADGRWVPEDNVQIRPKNSDSRIKPQFVLIAANDNSGWLP
jgi:hypothetical protein